MILYHYTAIELLRAIQREGLSKGDVAITPETSKTAVWLTTDPSPAEHGLSDGSFLPPDQQAAVEQLHGRSVDRIKTIDKRRVRITVVIPSIDGKLKEWSRYAKIRLTANWRKILDSTGGGTAKAATWWLYFGVIPVSRFKTIEVRGSDGKFKTITNADWDEADSRPMSGTIVIEDDGSETTIS